tara:strand:+ start:209 stop:4279 length:4071 start_codon:yes stop_codon:yes gene_type:complete
MAINPFPKGNTSREAVDSLGGYVYQIYQSAMSWMELRIDEVLYLEIAEDFATAANGALIAVQVKETNGTVTINSDSIIASIDSYVDLKIRNPKLDVKLRHLTTSKIAKEKSSKFRIGLTPALESWRMLAKAGDLTEFREILYSTKLSKETKNYIKGLDDYSLREKFLRKIHFDCGALEAQYLKMQLSRKVLEVLNSLGAGSAQVEECTNHILMEILKKSTDPVRENRIVDKVLLDSLIGKSATINISRTTYENQSSLVNQILQKSLDQSSTLLLDRLAPPKPIDEVPLPEAIAERKEYISSIVQSLTEHGVSWIYGSAGSGKTISAKLSAHKLGGRWCVINLRGLKEEQVSVILTYAIEKISEYRISGLIVDDIECSIDPQLLDKITDLKNICESADILLIFTSPKPCDQKLHYLARLPSSLEQKIGDFKEKDIEEILGHLGVTNKAWVKYIFIVSGAGHPQLSFAAIQSMQKIGWNISELQTMDSLINGNSAIELVRSETRKRLLNDMPRDSRKLLERLSAKIGSFSRELVLDVAKVKPKISDAGILFDSLIGSWIDQHGKDRYALSPLLSNFASKSLNSEENEKLNFKISSSLLKSNKIDPLEANAAFLAAKAGKNVVILNKLAMSILCLSREEIEYIAPHLIGVIYIRDDVFAYEHDPVTSQLIRAAQLMLLCHKDGGDENIEKLFDRFEIESSGVEDLGIRNSMMLLVFVKLLLSEAKFGPIPNFTRLVSKVNVLLENDDKSLPAELDNLESLREFQGFSVLGFLFVNQVRQIKSISNLIPVFEYLNSCEASFRNSLFSSLSMPELNVDVLINNAWLEEHKNGTIDPRKHSLLFLKMEEISKSWNNTELCVACRKVRVVLVDEYTEDRELALSILNEGLEIYGHSNSGLLRSKAKVLYRSKDYLGCLEIAGRLIESQEISNNVDRAYLCREAAICAESLKDFKLARHYYLLGSDSAKSCDLTNMSIMSLGLQADAALASWHLGDRKTTLLDFLDVLHLLGNLDPALNLRAAHCHAVFRHVLLWCKQDASFQKKVFSDNEETVIYPGLVSNPEPHSEIGEVSLVPMDMAWYLLASIENHCSLDVGISDRIVEELAKGRMLLGDVVLTSSKLDRAIDTRDVYLFLSSLRETVCQIFYSSTHSSTSQKFEYLEDVYQEPEGEHLDKFKEMIEDHILCFISNCIFCNDYSSVRMLEESITSAGVFRDSTSILHCLSGNCEAKTFNEYLAVLISKFKIIFLGKVSSTPLQVFELVYFSLRVAIRSKQFQTISISSFNWLRAMSLFIVSQQRFLLRQPDFYVPHIVNAANSNISISKTSVLVLLKEILPALGIANQTHINGVLDEMLFSARDCKPPLN